MDAKKRIVSKLEEVYVYLSELQSILPKNKKEYLNNTLVRRACERLITITIEAALDVLSLIASKERLGFPGNEDNIISLIEQKKILSSSLAAKVRNMKKFRNVLIHKYGYVDDVLVYQYLTEDLDDFILFEKEITKYLKALKEQK